MAIAGQLGVQFSAVFALTLALSAGAAEGQEQARIGRLTEISVDRKPASTRVTVLVEGMIDIRHGRLENPPRIFIDFLDTIPALGGEKGPRGAIRTVPAATALLRQIRVAENQKGLTRLVFDLEQGEIDYQTQVLRHPSRLLIEFKQRRPGTPPTLTSAPKPKPTLRFTMADPPVLMAKFVLPKAEPGQMPYRVGGFVLRDWPGHAAPSRPSRPPERPATASIAASRTSIGKQSLTRVLGLKIGKVVIDPGHGGHDVGSTGVSGLVEKEVTLDISRRLARLIEDGLGSNVVLTRTEDVYLSPEQRTEIANQQRADLFISIHANSSLLKTATGVETYYLNFTTSQEALEVAARENASSERNVADLGDLIKKIALKDKMDESREFAGKIQTALLQGSMRAGNRTRDRGVRKAPFIVLVGAAMPSVLAEVGFLSNAREEALLKKPDYRQKIAEALYRGVSQYANTLSHFAVAQRADND
jgi:N-acetylmuramoyl-L-alanine amidase